VPRVGRGVRELISQGAERLKVTLYFSVGGDQYRIHRESGRKTAKAPQLERFHPGEDAWLPEEVDRARDTNKYIEELLRMDYEAFRRSVLLPQGEFQEFLAGDRDQRRKVLDGLLRLGVYGVMLQKANGVAGVRGADADRIAERLATELCDATTENLARAREHLQETEKRAAGLAARREALDAACRLAETLASGREQQRSAAGKADLAGKQLAAAQELRDKGREFLAGIDEQIAGLERKAAATGYDQEAHLRLEGAEPLARQRDGLSQRLAEIERRTGEAREDTRRLDDLQRQEKDLLTEALRIAREAKDEFEQARKVNAAALLRQGLQPGDACPVCGQAVGELPDAQHRELDRLKSARDAAEDAAAKAQDAVVKTELQVKLKLQEAEQLGRDADQVLADRKSVVLDLAGRLPDGETPLGEIRRQVGQMEEARKNIEAFERQAKELAARRDEEARAIAGAEADVSRLQAEVEAHSKEAEAAATSAAKSEQAIKDLATAGDWQSVLADLGTGVPVGPALRRELQSAQAEENTANQAIGAGRTRIAQIESDIELAATLRSEEAEHREAATLARDLAALLRTDGFPTFIRERALQTLARDGSERLMEISGNRFSFAVEGQDFFVLDGWNAGDRRSVKTLSGGETFLASLALALALAENLPGLTSDGAESVLESLFIDEGFSHLDSETLDVVASALELLGQDRRRLIGVITHVPALAERMPSRIVVHKAQDGSSVTVE
jgi:exonuclease SbcC